MADEKNHDSEKGLQDELERESKEGKDSIGDAKENRNLSGSSTWETLPDSDKTKDKDSK